MGHCKQLLQRVDGLPETVLEEVCERVIENVDVEVQHGRQDLRIKYPDFSVVLERNPLIIIKDYFKAQKRDDTPESDHLPTFTLSLGDRDWKKLSRRMGGLTETALGEVCDRVMQKVGLSGDLNDGQNSGAP